jgi:membrane protease YdiL (CAAX protease family)
MSVWLPSRAHLLQWGDVTLYAFGGLVGLAAVAHWARAGRRDPLRGSPIRPNRLTPLTLWVCLCGFLIALWAGAMVASLCGFGTPKSGAPDPRTTLVAMPAAQVLVVAMCLVAGRLTFSNGWRGFGIGRRPIGRDAVWAVGAWLVSLAMCAGIYWITVRLVEWIHPQSQETPHQILTALRDPSMPGALRFLAVAGALVLAPASEELFFRGVLQSGVKKLVFARWGSLWHRWIALGLTAALFGAMHYATPHQVPALIALGLLLGYLYERTGSLTLPVLVHLLFNGKSLLWNALKYGS